MRRIQKEIRQTQERIIREEEETFSKSKFVVPPDDGYSGFIR